MKCIGGSKVSNLLNLIILKVTRKKLWRFIAILEREELAQPVQLSSYTSDFTTKYSIAQNFLDLEGLLMKKESVSHVRSGLFTTSKLSTKVS